LKDYWCIPPKQSAEFVHHMEDVISVYERPYNPDEPVVCMDEKPYQLLGDPVEALPMRPETEEKEAKNTRVDYEYERNGTCSIFGIVEPLTGRQHISVRERRTGRDWAEEMKHISDKMYPDARKIILVMDNLNTHNLDNLYSRYPPKEAFRISQRFEIHYTPKHGSWLDIAEIELNILTRQCLQRRIESIEKLRKETAAWEKERNNNLRPIEWHFSIDKARTKLVSLYPNLPEEKVLI